MKKTSKKSIKSLKQVKIYICDTGNYLDDWININDKSNGKKCDINWDLVTECGFKRECVDEIYIDDLYDKIEKDVDYMKPMLTNLRAMLKPQGVFKLGLRNPVQRFQLEPWLKGLGFPNLEFCMTEGY